MRNTSLKKPRKRFNARASELLRKQACLLDLATDTIMIRDLEDRIIYWNGGAERLYGWSYAEARNQYVHSFLNTAFPYPLEKIKEEFLDGGYWSGVLVHTARGGRRITVDSRWTLYRNKNGKAAAYLEINNDVTEKLLAEEELKRAHETLEVRVRARTSELLEQIAERKRAEKALRKSESRLRALSVRLMTAQEEERKRISRELHDDLGQILTSMKLDLQRVLKTENEPKRRALIERVLLQNSESRNKLRTLSSLLRPGVLDDVGLKEAIHSYITEFSLRTGIEVNLRINTENREIPSAAVTHLYRILQEALNNVSRHAEATIVQVLLTSTQAGIVFEIEDNGIGITSASIRSETAFGILGMKERSELLGGEFKINSLPGKGTCVSVTFPVHKPIK
jgi:PAS domain S-box-containing protein